MNAKQEHEINLYDYWKVLVKRKKILLGIFFIPVILAVIIALIIPRYYRGISEMTNTIIPASNIVDLIGNIDDAKKNKIFTNNSGAIKSVLISIPNKSTDKIKIIIDAKTADVIPKAINDILNYVDNLPEIKDKLNTMNVEKNYKIKKLIEAKKANLIFLNYIIGVMKKKQLMFININPADLIKRDADLCLEIKNLELVRSDVMKKKELNVKVDVGILGPPLVTKQPSNAKIKQIIIITGILSIMAGVFIVFFLDYIERMKARESK